MLPLFRGLQPELTDTFPDANSCSQVWNL